MSDGRRGKMGRGRRGNGRATGRVLGGWEQAVVRERGRWALVGVQETSGD